MKPRALTVECRLYGIVLTCFVDGQKLFKPLRLENAAPPQHPPSHVVANNIMQPASQKEA